MYNHNNEKSATTTKTTDNKHNHGGGVQVEFPVFFLLLIIIASSIIPCAWTGFACMENPCMHGICIDSLKINSSHQCYCRNGFTGYSCQINWDECRSNPCLNGGSCVDGIASFNCSCPENFAGVLCEVDLSVCEEAFPCQNNGTCGLDTNNVTGSGFICSCPPGFTGYQCEIDISVCNSTENVCQNGGKCVDGVGTRFYCECEPGWSGETCHIDIDECESQPCLNGGICVNKVNDFSCACPFGYTGRACETKLRICEENPCLNGAFCLNEQNNSSKKTCYCVPDYHGTLCELRYDDCDPSPKCFNGGTCIDGVGEFTCSCPPDFFGPTCQCTADNATEPECVDYVNTTAIPPTTMISPSLSLWSGIPQSETAIFFSSQGGTDEMPIPPTPTMQLPPEGTMSVSVLPEGTISVSVPPEGTILVSVSPSLPISDLYSTADLEMTKDIVQSSPAVASPSPSPYDPGGGGEGRADSIFPSPDYTQLIDDSSFYHIQPTQTYISPPPTLLVTSIPGVVDESSGVVSPTQVNPGDGGVDTGTIITYEPSSTIILDGSESSLGVSFQLASTPVFPPQPSSDIIISEESLAISPALSSRVPDYSESLLITPPSDTTKIELDASPTVDVDIISTLSVPLPPGIHTVDLTADFPLPTTTLPDGVVEQTEELYSSPSKQDMLTPTPSIPLPVDETPEVSQQPQGEIEQSLTPHISPTPFTSLQPIPPESSIELIDSMGIIATSLVPSGDWQVSQPVLSQTPDLAISTTGPGPEVVTLTPVIGVSSDEALIPEPSSSTMFVAPPHPQPSSSITLVDTDYIYDTVSVSTPIQVVTTPTPELSSPFPVTTPSASPVPSSTPTTTLQPNTSDPCTDYCHNNAKCIADSIEPICLCSFKHTGNRCEIRRDKFRAASFTGDSFLSFRVPNDSVISKVDIRSKLVTIVPEGILLYTGVGKMYALIFTQSGHVTLHFSCGSQSMHFVETRTRVDNGYNFTLDFKMEMIVQGEGQLRCSAEVSVNQSYIMKGEQLLGRDGVIFAERPIETVFLGGVPPFHIDAGMNDDLVGVLPGFRGCLHNLVVNQEQKDIFDDALDGKEVNECSSFGCVANPCHGSARCATKHVYPFWECICPQGYKGRRCQIIVCSTNPCQNGATCTYSQESLEAILANTTAFDDDAFSLTSDEEHALQTEFTTLSPSVIQQLKPLCLCPLGFSGSMCQVRINVTKPSFRPTSGYSAYIAYDPIPRFIDWFQLKFHFVTKNISQISLLLYSGNDRGPQPLSMLINHRNHEFSSTPNPLARQTALETNHMMSSGFDQTMVDAHPEPVSDFFAITFLQGFVALTWNLGSGTQRITTPSRIDNRLNIHTLFAGRSGRQAWLKVDGMRNVTGKTPGPLYRLNSDSNELYIGGYKSYRFEGLSHDLPLHQGFQGCIFDLGFRVKNRLYLPRPIGGRNVKNCFEEDC